MQPCKSSSAAQMMLLVKPDLSVPQLHAFLFKYNGTFTNLRSEISSCFKFLREVFHFCCSFLKGDISKGGVSFWIWTFKHVHIRLFDSVEISNFASVCFIVFILYVSFLFASVLFSFIHPAQDFYHSELFENTNVYVVQWLRERCL